MRRRLGTSRTAACVVLALGLSACASDTPPAPSATAVESGAASSQASESIPQPQVPEDLAVAPDSERVDIGMPTFSDPTAGGGDVEALALALPTDAGDGATPAELESMTSAAHAVLEAARGEDWAAAAAPASTCGWLSWSSTPPRKMPRGSTATTSPSTMSVIGSCTPWIRPMQVRSTVRWRS